MGGEKPQSKKQQMIRWWMKKFEIMNYNIHTDGNLPPGIAEECAKEFGVSVRYVHSCKKVAANQYYDESYKIIYNDIEKIRKKEIRDLMQDRDLVRNRYRKAITKNEDETIIDPDALNALRRVESLTALINKNQHLDKISPNYDLTIPELRQILVASFCEQYRHFTRNQVNELKSAIEKAEKQLDKKESEEQEESQQLDLNYLVEQSQIKSDE